ncbi:hypothetical protein VTK56DRAFT_1581 [Thermocarpiscus australiensis]
MELPPTDKLVDSQRDALYDYNPSSQSDINAKRPWASDPHYFKTVRISAVALIKMVMHARAGGPLEVMGIMQGYVDGPALVVTDAFRLPVEGTETRVNAQGDAVEYLVQYLSLCRHESRAENVIGWYHSHPGYGCWLSGIDVATQQLQQLQGPMVAVVVDPDRTVSANRVDIGAFRTYPDNYNPPVPATSSSSSTTVPMNKADDFGAHASRYYALEVEHFKSTLDARLLELLWNKYWVRTLAQNPLLTNRDFASSQMYDLAHRVQQAAAAVSRAGRGGGGGGATNTNAGGGTAASAAAAKGPTDLAIEKIVRDVSQVAAKERAGLMAAEVKAKIFGSGSSCSG